MSFMKIATDVESSSNAAVSLHASFAVATYIFSDKCQKRKQPRTEREQGDTIILRAGCWEHAQISQALLGQESKQTPCDCRMTYGIPING